MIAINELTPEDAAREIMGAQIFRLVTERRAGRPARALTRLQRFLMMLVARRGPLPVSELVELLEVGPTTASQFIKTLEERGWLSRSLDERDRRRHLVAITDVGRRALADAERRDRERLERVLNQLTGEERALLVRLAHRIFHILSTSPDLFRAGDSE